MKSRKSNCDKAGESILRHQQAVLVSRSPSHPSLDAVYVQAKRWSKTVGVEELRNFVGALSAHKAQKGVFITTSSFAKSARDYISQVTQKIVLIDGARLAELLIDYRVCVSARETYVLKRVDEDYFAEG